MTENTNRDDRTVISFTETWSAGSRTNTRTATVTILANGDPDKAMAFLKNAVRDNDVAAELKSAEFSACCGGIGSKSPIPTA